MIDRIFVRHKSGRVTMSVDANQIIYRERLSILKPVLVRYIKRCQSLGLDPSELEVETDKQVAKKDNFVMKGCSNCCKTFPVDAKEKNCPECGKSF